jgi:WD40 repeat protein
MHQRTIFSLKWNSLGTMLLTGSLDNTVCLWEISNGKVKQQWSTHGDSVLDVDWNDDTTFASASMDKAIHRELLVSARDERATLIASLWRAWSIDQSSPSRAFRRSTVSRAIATKSTWSSSLPAAPSSLRVQTTTLCGSGPCATSQDCRLGTRSRARTNIE